MNRVVHAEQADVNEQLRALSPTLTSDILRSVAERAGRVLLDASDMEPMAGVCAWNYGTAHLRHRLVPNGWEARVVDRQPRTIHEQHAVSIIVAQGSEEVGTDGPVDPVTVSPKGLATKTAVRDRNALTLGDIDEDFARLERKYREHQEKLQRVWILMFHLDRSGEEIRSELSLPIKMDDDGNVLRWGPRILLPPVRIDAEAPLQPLDDEADEDDEVEVTLRADSAK